MNERQLRAAHQLRDDQAVVRAAAGLLRDPEVHGRWAGLSEPATAELLAGLLDRFAEVLDVIDPHVRDITVRACRDLIGDQMDRPAVRRTRRR